MFWALGLAVEGAEEEELVGVNTSSSSGWRARVDRPRANRLGEVADSSQLVEAGKVRVGYSKYSSEICGV